MNFINILGALMALCLLIPDMKFPLPSVPRKRFFEVCGLIGWFGGLFLLSFNIGILELEYYYEEFFWIWLLLGGVFAGGYLFCHLRRRSTSHPLLTLGLSAFPFLLFLSSGLLLGHLLFFPCALLFLVGKIPDFFRADPKASPPPPRSRRGSGNAFRSNSGRT